MSKDWVGSNVSAFKMIGASNHNDFEMDTIGSNNGRI